MSYTILRKTETETHREKHDRLPPSPVKVMMHATKDLWIYLLQYNYSFDEVYQRQMFICTTINNLGIKGLASHLLVTCLQCHMIGYFNLVQQYGTWTSALLFFAIIDLTR